MKGNNLARICFVAVLFLFFAVNASAIQQLVSLQGKVTSSGALLDDSNITVAIFDAATGGNEIYNSSSDFDNKIQEGYFDIMLGSSTVLTLNLTQNYWLEMTINGEDVDFSGSERKQFQSPVGKTISGNLTIGNTVTATSFVGNGSQLTGIDAIPSGVIVMWSGSIADIPTSWALCNGSNGTPDLRDRFIVGAGSSYAVDNTGGEASHTLIIAEMPAHTHSYNQPFSTGYVSESGDRPRIVGSSTTTGSTGGNAPHENRPPYYALAYIMKL